MSAPGHIATVAIAGGGITAWSTAAALKRRIPSLQTQLIVTPAAPDALADRIASTLPSIQGFHQDIGLTDADTISGAASGLRLGSLFDGWADDRPGYIHAYGPYGASVGGAAFHQLWLRDRATASLPPFDHFSPGAARARSGADAMPVEATGEYGLQLSLDRYGEMMRAYALHLGVAARDGVIADVALRGEDGFIDRVTLADGSTVAADLFVDCTGPEARLHSTLGSDFIAWDQWLPCDRVLVMHGPPNADTRLVDQVTALPFGWHAAASSPRMSSRTLVYSSAHASDDQLDLPPDSAEPIALRQGRKPDFWVRNCVAIGDAAVSIEPLEWTNLHLVHSQIDRLIAMMPGRDCAPVELAQFNRECGAEADRVRDFVCLHYVCARRSEPFWKDAASIAPPSSLAHTLALFKERGRLPYYEEETFGRDSWLAVLLGQGVEPRRIDPLADLAPPAVAGPAFAAMRQSLETFTLPAAALLPELNPQGIR